MNKIILVAVALCSITLSFGQDNSKLAKELEEWIASGKGNIEDQTFANKKLAKSDVQQVASVIKSKRAEFVNNNYKAQWDNGELVNGEYKMKFTTKVFGEEPKDGRSMYISLHGGGNTHPLINDGQWKNQKALYAPKEGVYFVPRSPIDDWNMWHREYMDGLLDKAIECAVLYNNVNPNKVYILGYSAGGDGLYQLAPRMADRWAAASMMAGHPNNASALPLRNMPFAIFMGAQDGAYDRNVLATKWNATMDELQKNDPQGYIHDSHIYEGLGHWMERRDTVALDWMSKFQRKTYPDKVVWVQDDVLSDRLYWLGTRKNMTKEGDKSIVTRNDNVINIEYNDNKVLLLLLNDDVVDMDRKVTVQYDGKTIFSGKINRTIKDMCAAANMGRGDNELYSAVLEVVDNSSVKQL